MQGVNYMTYESGRGRKKSCGPNELNPASLSLVIPIAVGSMPGLP